MSTFYSVTSVSVARFGKRVPLLNFVRLFEDLDRAKTFARIEAGYGYYSQCDHYVFLRRVAVGGRGDDDDEEDEDEEDDIDFTLPPSPPPS